MVLICLHPELLSTLSGQSQKAAELTKDISAFANAAGGVLIYGIAEFDDKAKRHLPERLDPVDQTQFSREWLDQKIGLIRPRIEGLKITPVHVGPAISDYCYVVEMPQSGTAHQARDFRYYRRRSFEVTPMEDYEVRDVMGRRKHPTVDVKVRLAMHWPHEGTLTVSLRNTSRVLARQRAALVSRKLPLDLRRREDVESRPRQPQNRSNHLWLASC